ncbi:MAG: hypothetical protein AAGI07_13915 [Bacteroidota bacterium]
MNKHDIETKLSELKGKQSAIFNVKKDKRDTEALASIRQEISDLKSKLKDAPKKEA